MKRVVFMGTPCYAVEILAEILRAGYEVPLVLTQPDKPIGRKQILTPPDVKKFLLEQNFKGEILQPPNLKNDEIANQIKDAKPDFIVVAAYGQILPKKILQIASCINLHASILPKFRGASPIQSAILSGEKIGGVTAMMMDVGLDDGDMLSFSFMDIDELNSQNIFDEFAKLAANLIVKTLDKFDEIQPVPQTHALSSKCVKIKKENGVIKFSDSCDEVLRKFRAFTPWPGIFLENGIKLIDIKKDPNLFDITLANSNFSEGEVVNLDKNSFTLQFKDGQIKVFELQEVGKKVVLAKDFINGKRLKVGDRIC